MKRISLILLAAMLIIIVPTSCSKEDDPYHIDKTYAADDFVKTARTIHLYRQ